MDAGGSSGNSSSDRMAQLVGLRKNFAAFLKTKSNKTIAQSAQQEASEQLLIQFLKVSTQFTADEFCAQFKEHILFTAHLAEELVQEIRRRASSENTREAAQSVYAYLRAEPPNSRGWSLLNAVIFIANSGLPKVFDCLCKTLVPNTLVKVAYLFMDLPQTVEEDNTDGELAYRRRLYDSLVMLIMNLCSQPQVAEELTQKDDLFLLFIGASSRSPWPDNIWRNAKFTFLCALMTKALTPAVLKYIQTKRCIAHYLSNIGGMNDANEQAILLCNLLDLLRSSAENSQKLVEDFGAANGYQFTVDCCCKGSLKNAEQILLALTNLISAGDQTVQFQIPQQNATAHFHSQKMVQTIARSTGTVRCMGAYKVLERCFTDGPDELCLLVVDKIGHIFRAERMNYFIVDESSSLFLITETMMAKCVEVQEKVLELVEMVLRVLNYVPYKEIASLNLHLKNSVAVNDFGTMQRMLHFFLKIISINATLRDAFRELLVLDTFLHIVQTYSNDISNFDQLQIRQPVQLSMDLLINATKGNMLNAQFITENMDVRIVKTLLQLLPKQTEDKMIEDELKSSITILIKQLLYLAKNEQLFSSILQLLFSEPDNVDLCIVILKLFNNVLLESHKVRIMFRRSGGYICLMTLLLHLENWLNPSTLCNQLNENRITLQYVALIFQVFTVSMRFEPSNAKYFQNEVRPSIVNSILRNLGCFNRRTKVDAHHQIWEKITLENCASKLAAIHSCFSKGNSIFEGEKVTPELPDEIFYAIFILRQLLELAIDHHAKPASSADLHWANPKEWLANVENLETIPLLLWTPSTVLAHPSAIFSILQLLPSIGGVGNGNLEEFERNAAKKGNKAENDDDGGIMENEGKNVETDFRVLIPFLDEWSATAQLYVALILKAILRVERNQQTMCQFDMPAKVLEVGEELFKMERHPLLSSFQFYEKLAYQSLHSSELRHFLRMDKPLCCTNLDDMNEEKENVANDGIIAKSGGQIPIHRIKAFISMLTPKNHAFVHSPSFVEFDMAVEGFAALLIPSISHHGTTKGQNCQSSSSPQVAPGTDLSNPFQPSAGFTLAMWFQLTDCPQMNDKIAGKMPSTTPPITSICLFTIVRSLDEYSVGGSSDSKNVPSAYYGHQMAANIENHQICFQIHLQRGECCWALVISGEEHSVADELRKDFHRSPEHCIQVPLSEQYFPQKQWAHLAFVITRPALMLKSSGPSGVEVFINGRLLASQKLVFPWGNNQSMESGGGGTNAGGTGQSAMHAYIGTLPFFRRPTQLKWRLASLYLVEESLTVETLRKIVALGAAYLGNLQCSSAAADGPVIAEKKILLSLNAAATAETNAQILRSMISAFGTDAELITSLLGISPNDTSTSLIILWNMATSAGSARQLPIGAVLIGYLGIRTFVPCPVNALLDSIGGLLPLFGLIAMSNCSAGLYASLKVLVSALHTNDSIRAEMQRQRGFQTLAILLEEKASLMNSHILHLILTLAGTVDDGSKEQIGLSIPSLQTFEDLLCDLDVWREAPKDVWKLLLEHFFELIIETNSSQNLQTIRQSQLLGRLCIYLTENRAKFPIRNEIPFRLISAIVQPPCDGQCLLRLGQTISGTIAFDLDETNSGFPFHIVELEKKLLEENSGEKAKYGNEVVSQNDGIVEIAREEIENPQLYAVFMRNRLLNIICTMLAHSNAQVNAQLCGQLVQTLGFGWILALCGPRVHNGTLLMALRILSNLLRYPTLLEQFRNGSANGGWLSDADSVIRNRAAVLLGFSVANQIGAVGAHVDINPELNKCSGFASLEHVAYAHADKPFLYLALLAILFQQPNANIQPLDEFSVESIWSNVFALGAQCSVVDAIERTQFCPDAIVSILATIRAALHKQFEWMDSMDDNNDEGKNAWATNFPLRLLQLFNFLYQNSAQYFAICHTEAFVVCLFSSLLPPIGTPQTPNSATQQKAFNQFKTDSVDENQREEQTQKKTNSIAGNRCVRQCLEFLTKILLNDLCLSNETRSEPLFDAIIEFLDCNGPATHNKQNQLFTELVNACLDHFMASKMFFATTANPGILIVPTNARAKLNQSSEQTSIQVVRFLSRVIDTVWNCTYKGNPIRILKCFLKLLAESHASNKAAAQLQCTDGHIASLFRLILYLLSRPIDNIDTQMCVLDTLAEIVRNQHLFLTPKSSIDPLFYGALVHLVFMLSDRPQFDLQNQRNRQLEKGTAQVSICAQSVWGILWQQKKTALEEWFRKGELELDLFTARAKCGAEANKAWLHFVDSQTDGSYSLHIQNQDSSSGRLLVAQKMLPQQLQSGLSKMVAIRSGIQRLRNKSSTEIVNDSSHQQSTQWLNSLLRFDDERLRVEPETFYMWIRVHISLLRELIRSQCQSYHEWHAHVRKWCLQEWHSAEAELTRQRGLWGPDRGSTLDKFQLDVTEGPCRIRRKLVPNPNFYQTYPYRPHLDAPGAKPLRAKVAISFDSKAFYERMKAKRAKTMDERGIVDWQMGGGQQISPGGSVERSGGELLTATNAMDVSAELNMSLIKRMVQKNLEIEEKIAKSDDFDKTINGKEGNEEKSIEEKDVEDDDEEEEEVEEEFVESEEIGNKMMKKSEKVSSSPSTSMEEKSMTLEMEKNQSRGPKDVPPKKEENQQTQQQQKRQRDISIGPGKNSESVGQGPDNQTLLRLLEQGEQLHSMFRCARVQGLDTMEGLLLFGKDHFYVVDGFTLLKTREIRDLDFLPEQFHDPIIPYIAMGSRSRPQSTKTNRQCNKFAYDDIKEVHKRRYLLQQIALEVFSSDGRNFLLAFPRKVRDRVYQKIVSMAKKASNDVALFMQEQKKLRPTETTGPIMGSGGMIVGSLLISQLLSGGQAQSITHKWQRGEISNFHYLMYLNTLAGRSYNDLSQYPIFPWILADYDSEYLDLINPKTFRDLSKPMGAQSSDRLSQFLKRFREWDDPSGTPPYMYGTHYSSAMIVLSYLVRLEPFTQQFLKLQGGHFDLADRMFHSIGDAYWSAAKNNMADVKELIPEFFYLPEMFLNANRFDFGIKQSGVRVDDVQLPAWANEDPYEFVRMHRMALECDYVSEHLHEWIDLIFGYRQTGEPAVEANNVFHHLFYETSVDIESIEDPLQRNATLGFINNFGQIPAQLFKKPHPQRKIHQQSHNQGNPQTQSTVNSPTTIQIRPGLSTPKLFYHAPEQLRVSPKPVKELRAAIGEIVLNEKGNQVIVLEENKLFIPPTSYLAWGFYDRSIRFGTVGQDRSNCILETNNAYEISCMATADGRQVFAGLATGTINIWSLQLNSSSSSTAISNSKGHHSQQNSRLTPKRTLVGHSDVITALAASSSNNVLLSGSRDKTAILWHLTKLNFIRQLPGPHPGPICAVAINEAKGDCATASGHWLFLFTVNGVPLAVVNTLIDSGLFSNANSLILCIAFSTANDWDDNNVVICGTSDGLVKMYSCERAQQNATNSQAENSSPSEVDAKPKLNQSVDDQQQQKAVKDHLLRRQQRIQQHHSHYYAQHSHKLKSMASEMASTTSEASSSASPNQGAGGDGATSPSISSSGTFSRQTSQQQKPNSTSQIGQQQIVPTEMVDFKWIRTLRLRRILSEHTAFTSSAGNAQPAPITAIRPTKDHRSLLVGDGVGRIWMWTIGGGQQGQGGGDSTD